MKTAKINQGEYVVTGYTKAGELVQYSVERNGSWWAVDLVCGKGVALNMLYSTKGEAVAAIKNQ